MSDSNTLAPEAGTADAHPESVRDAANSLPDDVFGWDDDEGDQNGAEPARAEPARQERPAPQDRGEAQQRAGQPRDQSGRFAAQGEPEGDAEPQEGEGETEGETGEAEAQAGEGEEEPKPEPKEKKAPSFSIEIDGQHYTAEDVRRGFLRQDDYTRKTQELSQGRQVIQQEAQRLQAHEQELANVLNLAVSALQDTMPARPAMDLLRQDPIAYHEQMALHTAAVERLQGLVGHQQQAGQRQSAQQQELARQEQERERAALVEAQNSLRQTMPALFSEQGRTEFLSRVEKHSAKLGLGRGDIDMIQDPRAFPVLDLAMKYLDLQDRKPAAVQRAQSAPPIRPAARPGAGTRTGQVKRDAEQRFRSEPTAKNLVDTGVLDRFFGND